MTILAVDPGIATCGWAIVQPRTGRVLDLGVITSEPDPAIAKSTDRARRIDQQLELLHEAAASHAITVVSAEAMSVFGRVNAVVSQVLCWGAVIGLSQMLAAELREVPPKTWQRAVVPDSGKAVDYARVEADLARFADGQVRERLAAIKPRMRTHALDAVGVGVYTALEKTTRIARFVIRDPQQQYELAERTAVRWMERAARMKAAAEQTFPVEPKNGAAA